VRVCLIGSTHPSYNPRLVREADALVSAGHEVRVIAPWFSSELAERDRRLVATRGWQLRVFDYRSHRYATHLRSLILRARRKLAFSLHNRLHWYWLIRYAYIAALPELSHLACQWQADWYIAHTQGSLPAAAEAASRWNARLGFDCEDLLSELGTDPAMIVTVLEQKYLHLCDYVSVPSQAMADFLHQKYTLQKLIVLYNVFPLSSVIGVTEPAQRQLPQRLRLHWFSQTIGPNRGLEDIIQALPQLKEFELHLRGSLPPHYSLWLNALLDAHQIREQVFVHQSVDPDRLNATLANFDIGLALERSTNTNHNLTVSNKLFCYLLAGLAVCATRTVGQKEIFDQVPTIGFMYNPGDIDVLVRGLRMWYEDRLALRQTQSHAWQFAREKFCWDIEQSKYLDVISKA